jgi:hypothetical protein
VGVFAHELGGIACVDLLAMRPLPQVKGLVTVGSQAPYLHEIGALRGIRPGTTMLPPHFPRWLNVYDPYDFLSYVAEGVFDRGVLVARKYEGLAHSTRRKTPTRRATNDGGGAAVMRTATSVRRCPRSAAAGGVPVDAAHKVADTSSSPGGPAAIYDSIVGCRHYAYAVTAVDKGIPQKCVALPEARSVVPRERGVKRIPISRRLPLEILHFHLVRRGCDGGILTQRLFHVQSKAS